MENLDIFETLLLLPFWGNFGLFAYFQGLFFIILAVSFRTIVSFWDGLLSGAMLVTGSVNTVDGRIPAITTWNA